MKTNQLRLGAMLSYVSTGLNMVLQLVYTPIMIRILGQSEYGLYTLVGSVVSYLSLFSLGFTGAYLRFYSRYKEDGDAKGVERLNGLFLTLFCVMSLLAVSCGMVLSQFTPQLFGENLSQQELQKAKLLMQILVVNIALTFPSALFDSIVGAHEQFLFQRLLQIAGVLFNPLICLPLLLCGFGSVALVCVTTAITVAKLLVNAVFCIKKLRTRFDFSHFDWRLLKEIAGFSFFLFLNMIIDQVNWSVGKFILGRTSGTAAVAVYGVGAQMNTLFFQFSTAISSVFAPRVNRIAAAKRSTMLDEFAALFVKVGRIQFAIMMLIASGITFFGRYFITDIYVTEEYEDAWPVALLLILPAVIPVCQNLGIEIQRAVNKHRVRSILYLVMAIVNILISIPLASSYGPIGAAMGTAFSLLAVNVLIMNIYYHKGIGINITAFWKSILSLSKGMLLPAALGVYIMTSVRFSGLASFAVWVIVYALVYIFSFLLFGLNREEKTQLLGILSKLKNRKAC